MVPVEMYSFHISLQNVVIIFFILIIQLLPVLIGMMTDPAYRCFQFDKQPQFIAIFNELFCRRIMRGSDEVTVGSPIQFCIGLPFLIGQRTSVKRMSLMTQTPLNLTGRPLTSRRFPRTSTSRKPNFFSICAMEFSPSYKSR